MKISVITPTKDRPEAVELCKRWFAEQTYPVHEHLVMDGDTMMNNLRDGMAKATGDVILFADDDDYYGPGWVQWVADQYRSDDIQAAGQVLRTLYHIRAERLLTGCSFGPLAGTLSFRVEQCDAVYRHMNRSHRPKRIIRTVKSSVTDKPFCYRILGLYRTGMSQSHDSDRFKDPDPGLKALRDAVGDEVVNAYLGAMEQIDARINA